MSEKQFKSVKEYRREIDNLFRQVNSHYHACRGLNEFESFAAQLKSVSDRVAGLACKRANSDDLASHARALCVAAECAAKVQDKINELSDLKAYFVKKRH
ncbi:hypothetical protein KFE26_23595 [Shewanella sp. M16]|uniref:hypothetical protein n=1 Tax=Shewanella sp. M16 TaxID=2830837 RepID=UPI001BB064A5|nr:hypothetical protein [Shewanella sp. M16]MBS0045218.1 hypothetical protein [Shewanella sp. M16]